MNEHNRAAGSRFDALASGYDQDRIAPWFQFFQELAISKLDISKGSGFLDVGCGTGWAVREAAKYLKSGQACGIDISPKMIEVAIAQTPRRTNIEFRVGNSEAIPYPNDTFSSVLCTSSFHHYQNPIKSLLEIRRVMVRGGKLVIVDPARDVSLAIWVQDRLRRYFEPSHVRYYSTNELKALVQEAQFQPIGEITTVRRIMFRRKVFTGLMLLEARK